MSKEIFDWQQHEWSHANAPDVNAHLDVRKASSVNPVTGHGNDCMCPRCPGWYADRVPASVAPAARPGNPLLDQVVPVCVLMGMVTVCGVVLVPVVAPLLGLAVVGIVALVVAIVALTVVLLILMSVFRRTNGGGGGQVVQGEVVKRRWLRPRV